MLGRAEALRLVEKYVSSRNLLLHMVAVEAIMRGLAERLGEDVEEWGMVGLLHDIDFELTKNDPSKHTLEAEKILNGQIPDELIRTIKAHNHEYTGVKPEKPIDYALIAADAVSGLIVACALVMPSKRLEEVKLKTLVKKFRQKDFARKVSRERIMECEKLGLKLEEFLEISLESMKKVAGELGL